MSQGKVCSWTCSSRSQNLSTECHWSKCHFTGKKTTRSTSKALSRGRTVQTRNLNFIIPLFSKCSFWTIPHFHFGVVHFPHKTCFLLASVKAGKGIIYTKQTSWGHLKSLPFSIKLLLNSAVPIRDWTSFSLQLATNDISPTSTQKKKAGARIMQKHSWNRESPLLAWKIEDPEAQIWNINYSVPNCYTSICISY